MCFSCGKHQLWYRILPKSRFRCAAKCSHCASANRRGFILYITPPVSMQRCDDLRLGRRTGQNERHGARWSVIPWRAHLFPDSRRRWACWSSPSLRYATRSSCVLPLGRHHLLHVSSSSGSSCVGLPRGTRSGRWWRCDERQLKYSAETDSESLQSTYFTSFCTAYQMHRCRPRWFVVLRFQFRMYT